MSTSSISPGLFEVTEPDGHRSLTNVVRIAGNKAPAGRALVNTAAVLLGVLDLGLFAVSLYAQYQYIFRAKHDKLPSVIEAVALDAGMIIFSLLALGLARGGQSARVERFLIVVCAVGSAAMNYGAADVSSPRSVAVYMMPPVFLAIVTDRVVAVVRRHVLGMEAERSAWASLGRALLVALAGAGQLALYGLRLLIAPRSTLYGLRRRVLLATPLPSAPVPVPAFLPAAPVLPPPPEAIEAGDDGTAPVLAALAELRDTVSALTGQAAPAAPLPGPGDDEAVPLAELLAMLRDLSARVDGALSAPWADPAETVPLTDVLDAVRDLGRRVDDMVLSSVPVDAESAALIALRATIAAGNPLTQNALMEKFGLTRTAARRVRSLTAAGSNGHRETDIRYAHDNDPSDEDTASRTYSFIPLPEEAP